MADTDPFLRVLRGLLRPLVKTLIARGVTAPAFYRLLKQVYVEVAEAEFRIADKPPTDSRVALLTGVHRRDVREILRAGDGAWAEARGRAAALATVLGQWIARPEFRDAAGRPMVLARTGEPGRDFESLVRGVSTDIRPRTVLDELLRQGLVTEDPDGRLRLTADALAGPGSDETRVVFFAANVGDHLAAAAENLLAEKPAFLERAVFYNRLTAGSVDRIETRARALAQAALEEVNRESSALQQGDRGAEGATERYRFGVYFFRDGGRRGDGA